MTKNEKVVGGVGLVLVAAYLAHDVGRRASKKAEREATQRAAEEAARAEHERKLRWVCGLARRALQHAAWVYGFQAPPIRFILGIDGAFADFDRGEVVVDPQWLLVALQRVCTTERCADHLALALAGHELGHLIDAWAKVDVSWQWLWRREMVADEVAGAILALAGGDPSDFDRFLQLYSADPSKTHPPVEIRRMRLARGYSMTVARLRASSGMGVMA